LWAAFVELHRDANDRYQGIAQYQRLIDSPEDLGCNRFIEADLIGLGRHCKKTKLRATCDRQEEIMSIIDQALIANQQYAKTYDRKQGARPRPTLVVVTCMDPRLSDLPGILGVKQADIDVIRTGGPAVTEDVLSELVVSARVLGTTEIMLLNHTGCGFTTFTDDELNAKLSASTGDGSPAPMRFFSYKDPDENTQEQIKKVRSHPWIAKDIPVRGFVFDVETGLLREVQQIAHQAAD
jgi:carbonic anhydrase